MAGLAHALSGLSLSAGKTFLSGSARVQTAPAQAPTAISIGIEAAHKKGAGSTKNGRDSNAKRLGIKVYGDQPCQAGSIIVRQRGTKFSPGENVGVGKDHTIYSLIDGVVAFERKGKSGKKISVYPAQPRVKNPDSRRTKHRAQFTPRALQAVAE